MPPEFLTLQFAPDPVLLYLVIVVAPASCFLSSVLYGKVLMWDSCSGDGPPGALTLFLKQRGACWPYAHQSWASSKAARALTKDLKWLSLRKTIQNYHQCLWAEIAMLYTLPPPSTSLHSNTHNQIEGCDQAYSWLVREKLILYNAAQPALQSLVATLL